MARQGGNYYHTLIQRINRKLATERGYVLKIMRGNRWRGKLGDYYAVDPKRICDGRSHVFPTA